MIFIVPITLVHKLPRHPYRTFGSGLLIPIYITDREEAEEGQPEIPPA